VKHVVMSVCAIKRFRHELSHKRTDPFRFPIGLALNRIPCYSELQTMLGCN